MIYKNKRYFPKIILKVKKILNEFLKYPINNNDLKNLKYYH